MSTLATISVGLIAALHFYILVLEMFLWDKPRGLRAFNLTPERAAMTKQLAANQGLYNGFLAAGLGYGVLLGPNGTAFEVFFLICVIVAGVFGALTVGKKILFIQAIPGLVALALVLAARG